jgi:hypothetical protein
MCPLGFYLSYIFPNTFRSYLKVPLRCHLSSH